MYKIAALAIVIASLVSYIAWDKWHSANLQCDIKIERINDESNKQVELAKKAADSIVPVDDLAALCLRDPYCRDKE
jgi:hypothetical protein